MSSILFQRACEGLTVEEASFLRDFLTWLESHRGLHRAFSEGARVSENLRAEAHLVGEGPFGEPAELIAFLRACAARFAATGSSTEERHRCYEEVCSDFQGRGLAVNRKHLPDQLLRYSTNGLLAADLVESALGSRARALFNQQNLPPETAFERLRSRWVAAECPATVRMSSGPWVFATFEHPAGAPREDAVALSQALALPLWQSLRSGPVLLFELTYATAAVHDLRFPTVADAGWIHLFHPAPESEPDDAESATCHGWTVPLEKHPAQPEVLHENAPLSIVNLPPRFVGSVRP